MIVTCHQPNYLPGLSVVEKVESADAVIWMDEVQFTTGGFTNRNRMPDGSWLTIPVDRGTTSGPINRVRMTERGDWRKVHQRTLRQHYTGETIEDICALIDGTRTYLVTLTTACLAQVIGREHGLSWENQSLINGGFKHLPVSEQIAVMVARMNGTVYLSGPSGRRYLDEGPFNDRDIEVRYFEWDRPDNPCVLERYRKLPKRQEVT